MEELGKFIAPKGSSFPSGASEGQLWFHTTYDRLYAYDGAAWISVADEPEIRHESVSASGSFTATKEWEHTSPLGSPKGALVLIVANTVTAPADEVTSVTFNGKTMEELTKSPFSHAEGAEDAMLYAYFLSGNPLATSGAMVKVTRTGAVAMAAVCITMTAPLGVQGLRAVAIGTKQASLSTEPFLELEPISSPSLSYFAMHSGAPSVGEVTINEISSSGRFLEQHDFGAATAHWLQSGGASQSYLNSQEIELKQSSNPYGIFGVSIGPVRDFGLVTSLPSVAGRGDTCRYIVDSTSGVIWDLIYDGEGEYPWKKIGGPPLHDRVAASGTRNNATYGDCTAGETGAPEVTVPLKGDYFVNHGAVAQLTGGASSNGWVSFAVGATAAINADAARVIAIDQFEGDSVSTKVLKTGLTAGVVIKQKYKGEVGTLTWAYENRFLEVDPIRVG